MWKHKQMCLSLFMYWLFLAVALIFFLSLSSLSSKFFPHCGIQPLVKSAAADSESSCFSPLLSRPRLCDSTVSQVSELEKTCITRLLFLPHPPAPCTRTPPLSHLQSPALFACQSVLELGQPWQPCNLFTNQRCALPLLTHVRVHSTCTCVCENLKERLYSSGSGTILFLTIWAKR